MLKTDSWWIGVDRLKFQQEIQRREEEWKRKGVGSLDFVSDKLRQQWDIGPPNKWQTH